MKPRLLLSSVVLSALVGWMSGGADLLHAGGLDPQCTCTASTAWGLITNNCEGTPQHAGPTYNVVSINCSGGADCVSTATIDLTGGRCTDNADAGTWRLRMGNNHPGSTQSISDLSAICGGNPPPLCQLSETSSAFDCQGGQGNTVESLVWKDSSPSVSHLMMETHSCQ